MDRNEVLLRGVSKEMLGVEIGPYHAPLVPKKLGYRSLGLDIHDREQLRKNAENDPNLDQDGVDRIETVDLIGSATDLAELVEEKGLLGQIDYVVSSHNFEHLPNPIHFLKACERILTPSGIISMAIPDRRGCFDYFRPYATTADFLGAYSGERDKPTITQLLLHMSLQSRRQVDAREVGSWDWRETSDSIYSIADLDDVGTWIKGLPPEHSRSYMDTHCWSFTKSSFELIIRDLHFMGFIDVGVDRLEGPLAHEFFARLAKGIPVPSKEAFYARRAELLHQVIDEAASSSRSLKALQRKVEEQEIEMRSLRNSKSWRYTAPFRRVSDRFRHADR